MCVCECASACECEQQTADMGAALAVMHTYAREYESLIYSTTWFIESAPVSQALIQLPAPSA